MPPVALEADRFMKHSSGGTLRLNTPESTGNTFQKTDLRESSPPLCWQLIVYCHQATKGQYCAGLEFRGKSVKGGEPPWQGNWETNRPDAA